MNTRRLLCSLALCALVAVAAAVPASATPRQIEQRGDVFTLPATASCPGPPRLFALLSPGLLGELIDFTTMHTLLVQRFDADGTLVGDFIEVASYDPHAYLRAERIAADGDGGFIVTWADEDTLQTYARRFGPDGAPRTDVVVIDTSTSMSTPPYDLQILPADGGFAVLSKGPSSLTARWLGSDLQPSGPPFTVAVGFQVGNHTLNVPEAGATVTADGDLAIAWIVFEQVLPGPPIYQVRSRRFGRDGQPAGAEQGVFAGGESFLHQAIVTAESDGGYAVLWVRDATAPDPDTILAFRFDADGNPMGSVFQLAEAFSDSPDIYDLAFATDASGDWWLTWTDILHLYAQVSTPSGGVLRPARQLDVEVAGDQVSLPALFPFAPGRALLAWQWYYRPPFEPPLCSYYPEVYGLHLDAG